MRSYSILFNSTYFSAYAHHLYHLYMLYTVPLSPPAGLYYIREYIVLHTSFFGLFALLSKNIPKGIRWKQQQSQNRQRKTLEGKQHLYLVINLRRTRALLSIRIPKTEWWKAQTNTVTRAQFIMCMALENKKERCIAI